MITVSIEPLTEQTVELASCRVNMHPNVLLCAYRARVRGRMCETEGNIKLRYFLSVTPPLLLALLSLPIGIVDVVVYVRYPLSHQCPLNSTNHIVI